MIEMDTLQLDVKNAGKSKKAERQEETVRRFISDMIQGLDFWENVQCQSQGRQRTYKRVKKFMGTFPPRMLEWMKSRQFRSAVSWPIPVDADVELAEYFLYGKVSGVFSTWALLSRHPYPDTSVSFWKRQGYFLSEYDLRSLHAKGFICADLKWDLDNINLIDLGHDRF
jgi:hypothetical protein